MWTGLIWLEVSRCQYGKEPWESIKCVEFLDYVISCKLHTKDSAPCPLLVKLLTSHSYSKWLIPMANPKFIIPVSRHGHPSAIQMLALVCQWHSRIDWLNLPAGTGTAPEQPPHWLAPWLPGTHVPHSFHLCRGQQKYGEAKACHLRTALFWLIAQRVGVISYRRFRTTCWSHLQRSSLTLKDGTDRFSRNISKKSPLLAAQ